LCEYDGQDVYQRHFAYGNYIDEVLFMFTDTVGTRKFYVHDHLYSPAALIDKDGNVVERYEYDAYGKVAIMDASYNPRSESLYENPYYFQGKQLDLLDNGGLELMSWPYRSYSTHLGRWTQAEKFGMIPNDDRQINPFDILNQYTDGMNLYEPFASNPVLNTDPFGTWCIGPYCRTGGRFCGILRYQNRQWFGHTGILMGGEDIDFGPEPVPSHPYIGPGECPWRYGGPGRDVHGNIVSVEKTPLLVRKTGRLGWGTSEGKLCCCATCGDVKTCVREVCSLWNGYLFSIYFNHCRHFVSDVKAKCCLKDY